MKTSKTQRVFFYMGIVLFLIIFGFFRDYFVKQFNLYLYQVYYKDLSYVVDEEFYFLKKFTYMQLYYAKYFITLLFCLIYFAVTLLVVNFEFHKSNYLWVCFYFYSAIFAVILIFYLYGMLLNNTERYAEISRSFLVLIQSPMLLMILFPAFILSSKQISKTT